MGICSFLFSLLIFISQTQVLMMYMAQGKTVPNHPQVFTTKGGSDEVTVSSVMIGSIPPRCERRCSSCGHCEAVQVPIAPNQRRGTKYFFFFRSDDYTSNYKPMSWKCKCGERFLNP